MKKLLVLCLAATGFAGLPIVRASAHEAPAVAALSSTARVNATVVIETHRHRRSRTIRRVYYRHGVRHVVIRRVYY